MESLYEKHRAAFDKLASDGFVNLAEASKWFTKPRDMDVQIGFHNAVHHWISGRPASRTSDERARRWLEAQRKTPLTAPRQKLAPAQAQGALLLVACPAGTEEKARKLLAFIGCEVTDV